MRSNRAFTLVAVTLAAVLAGLAVPALASAVSVTPSAVEVLDKAGFKAVMSSSDDTGTAVLVIDRKPVASKLATPGAQLDFGMFKLAPGMHAAQVVVRSRSGSLASQAVNVKAWGTPGAPQLVSPTPGGYAARYVACAVRPGLSTTMVKVYLNGTLFRTASALPGSLQNIGTMTLSSGVNTIEIVASNPMATTRATFKVTRLDYPWPTCIIIDKSDCKLYWIKNGSLVKVYPVAVGKKSTQTPVGTWKIGAKYITGPVGIYGPRKMRMYRQTKSGFVFTAYNIHGTNQEWVIGTWASHGCIRMYNKDVLEFYPQVAIGTMVQTRE